MSKFSLIILFFISFAFNGYASLTGRVVGGEYASEGQYSHQVSLRKNGFHTCGGSIINNKYILTAAHCVVTRNVLGIYVAYDPSILTVRAGSTDRFQGGVLMKVDKIIVHENYGNFLNDIALLKLEQPIIFSKNIQPIPLASSEVPVGAKVEISGWGRVKQGGDIPRNLKCNVLTVMSQKNCTESINFDADCIICLGHEPNNGACNGDSGGPAIYNGEIVGIAGFVYGGCGTIYPDGFAKVYYHVDWIVFHSI